MWIHVHGIADSMLLGQLHQAAQDIVVIGSAAVLCTDGYLTLRTLKALSHTAHVHGPGFGYALRNRGRTAVPHFLIDGKVGIHPALRCHGLILKILGITHQNSCRQLIIQETALDVSGWGNPCPGFKAHIVAGHDAKFHCILPARNVLVHQHFHRIPCALGLFIAAVYMYGGIHQLAGSLIDSVRLGNNTHILSLGIGRLHASYVSQLQPAVFLNLGNHASQGVAVGLQQDPVFLIPAAKISDDASLNRAPGLHPQCLQFL